MGNARLQHVGSNFTNVPNRLLDDAELSFRAKGLYSYLRSKPNDWDFRVKNITNAGLEGRDAIQKAIKELADKGYIERRANKIPGGSFDGWIWYIYETPINRETNGLTENPSDRKPVRPKTRQTEIQGEINNTIQNNTIHNNNINNITATFLNNEIDIKPVIKRYPGLLFSFSENEFSKVASVLYEKKKQGKIKNPVGLLMKNPESVIKQILENSFYPDVPKKKYDSSDESEIFSLPIWNDI